MNPAKTIATNPGPVGITVTAAGGQESTLARHNFAAPAALHATGANAPGNADATLLATLLYAETGGESQKEMIAIAQVVLRRAGAQGYSGLATYLASRDGLTVGHWHGHPRRIAFQTAQANERQAHPGMARAIECAALVLQGKVPDLAHGAWFWEGASLRDGGARHNRRAAGIRFTQPAHNLYHLPDSRRVASASGQALKTRAERDSQIAFETTAAYGASVFFKHPTAWLRSEGVQPWKEFI